MILEAIDLRLNAGESSAAGICQETRPRPCAVRRWQTLCMVFCVLLGLVKSLPAQTAGGAKPAGSNAAPVADSVPKPPAKVDVEHLARDSVIQERLLRILKATGWFTDPQVEVRDGVVFLTGQTQTEDFKDWAGDLATRTQDVAAIVNRIQVRESSLWDLTPARVEVHSLWKKLIASLPYFCIGTVVLVLAWWASRAATATARRFSERRIGAPLLRDVFARTIGFLVLLGGIYFVLHVAGLTRMAVTVVGGTGLLGLIIGIAFHDITENFLASLFLALQRPFQPGDLVTIADQSGLVHSLTTRTTNLTTLDGNQIQIPNSTVYKSTIQNFATNPNRRESFLVGIGYGEDIAHAQSIALQVLNDHPAVLQNPGPWALVDSLGSATVNLRIYFWLNGQEHSWLSVKSSVMRLVKDAFGERGISIPFEVRNTLSQPVTGGQAANGQAANGQIGNGQVGNGQAAFQPPGNGQSPAESSRNAHSRTSLRHREIFTQAEGELRSDADAVQREASQCRAGETAHNLLPAENASADEAAEIVETK